MNEDLKNEISKCQGEILDLAQCADAIVRLERETGKSVQTIEFQQRLGDSPWLWMNVKINFNERGRETAPLS